MPEVGQYLQSPQGQALMQGLAQQRTDPFGAAIDKARSQYPWLQRFQNMAITTGEGPFQSESYMPTADDNPEPGHYTVELHNDKLKGDPSRWPALLGRESIDWLARSDPVYQKTANAFIASMTPAQLRQSRARWKNEGAEGSFDDWMREAEAQEYIGGYLVPEVAPGWRHGEGKYTPQQVQMLDGLRKYLHGD